MRNAASFVYEDLLVANLRFNAARKRQEIVVPGRRPRRHRSRQALADIAHHRLELARWHQFFNNAGGDAALDPHGQAVARSIAKSRIRDDARAGRCLCHACPSVREYALR